MITKNTPIYEYRLNINPKFKRFFWVWFSITPIEIIKIYPIILRLIGIVVMA